MPDIKLIGNKNEDGIVIYRGKPDSSFSRIKSLSVEYNVSGGSKIDYDYGPSPTSTFSGSISKIFQPTCECLENVFNGGVFTISSTAYGEFETGRDEGGLPTYEWRSATRTQVWAPRIVYYFNGGSFDIYVSSSSFGENLVSDTDWQPSENLATGRTRRPLTLNPSIVDSDSCVYFPDAGAGSMLREILESDEPYAGGTALTYGYQILHWSVEIA